MRTLLHLSDLHFGRIDPATLGPLAAAARRVNPDLLVVSGDLTQRARPHEFVAARQFLDTLPFRRLVVPGNHDVPMHNLLARFLWPSYEYRRHIDDNTEPVYHDDELLVAGVNTARSLTIKNGRINEFQIARLHRMFCAAPQQVVKVVACHHPFDLPDSCPTEQVVGGACAAIATLVECGADLVLSGHYHVSHAACSTQRYSAAGQSLLLLAAGTATSTRRRGQANAFNVIKTHPTQIEIVAHAWSPGQAEFTPQSHQIYAHTPHGWLQPTETISEAFPKSGQQPNPEDTRQPSPEDTRQACPEGAQQASPGQRPGEPEASRFTKP